MKIIISDDLLLKSSMMSCKTLDQCPGLLEFVSESEFNIFTLTPCNPKEPDLEDQEAPQQQEYLCMEDIIETRLSEEAEIPSCNCLRLNNCQSLMSNFVSVQDWEGLAKQKFCGFDGKSPKYCC